MAENIEITGQTQDLVAQLRLVTNIIREVATNTTSTPSVSENVVNSWNRLSNRIRETSTSIRSTTSNMIQSISSFGSAMATNLSSWQNFKSMIQSTIPVIQSYAQAAMQAIRSSPITSAIMSGWKNFSTMLKDNMKSLQSFSGMMQTVMGAQFFNMIGDTIKKTEALNNQLLALKSHSMWAGLGKDFERLGEITGGLATKMQLLPSVSRATAFGIDLSNGKLEEFTVLAQKLGMVMGKDLVSSFDDLITGIGRQSVMIMDNLGILIKRGEANEKFAKSNGIAVRSMSAQQKMQAFLNETLLKGKEIVENIDMTKMTVSGTKAVAMLEEGMTRLKRWIAESFVNVGDSIGRFFFFATASMEEIEALKRAEAKENADRLATELFQTSMATMSQTESYKRFYEERKALGEKDMFIQQRYFDLYIKNAHDMNSYAFNSAVARFENEEKLRQRKIFDESIAFVEHTEQYKKFYEEQRSMGKSDLDIKKTYVQEHMKNIASITKDAFNDTMGSQTAIIDLFITGINKVEARWKQYQDSLNKSEEDDKEAKKKAKDDKEALEKWIEVRKIKADIYANSVEDEIKKERLLSAAIIKELRERQVLYNKTTDDNDKLKLAENALFDAKILEEQQKMRDTILKITQDSEKKRKEWVEKNNEGILDEIEKQQKAESDLEKKEQDRKDKEFDEAIEKLAKDIAKRNKAVAKAALKEEKETEKERLVSKFEFEKHMADIGKEGIRMLADFSATMIEDVMFGEKEFHKEMIGDFAKMIGSQLISKGTFNVLEGAIATAMGLGWGPTQLAVGGAEIAAGVGMGGIGKTIGTTSDKKDDDKKSEASKDRNNMNRSNTSVAKVNTYLFPSKRAYNQNLQQSNAEIYG